MPPFPAYADGSQRVVVPTTLLGGKNWGMLGNMRRIIARWLLLVFALGLIAPAMAATQPPQPMACHRAALVETKRAPSQPGMAHCNGMAGDSHRPVVAAPAALDPTFSRGCCGDHDCCRRQDRSQGLYLSPVVTLRRIDIALARLIVSISFVRPSAPSDDHSGRAPPAR